MSSLERLCCIALSAIGGFLLSWASTAILHTILYARYVQSSEFNPDASGYPWNVALIQLLFVLWIVYSFIVGAVWTLQSCKNLEIEI